MIIKQDVIFADDIHFLSSRQKYAMAYLLLLSKTRIYTVINSMLHMAINIPCGVFNDNQYNTSGYYEKWIILKKNSGINDKKYATTF